MVTSNFGLSVGRESHSVPRHHMIFRSLPKRAGHFRYGLREGQGQLLLDSSGTDLYEAGWDVGREQLESAWETRLIATLIIEYHGMMVIWKATCFPNSWLLTVSYSLPTIQHWSKRPGCCSLWDKAGKLLWMAVGMLYSKQCRLPQWHVFVTLYQV